MPRKPCGCKERMQRLEQAAPRLARLIRPLHERLMGEARSNAARRVVEPRPPEREGGS